MDDPKPSMSKGLSPDICEPDLDTTVVEAPPWKMCPVCGKGFSRMWQLDKHVYKAHSEIMKAYKCKFCLHLEVHKLSHEQEQFKCEECNAVYAMKSSL